MYHVLVESCLRLKEFYNFTTRFCGIPKRLSVFLRSTNSISEQLLLSNVYIALGPAIRMMFALKMAFRSLSLMKFCFQTFEWKRCLRRAIAVNSFNLQACRSMQSDSKPSEVESESLHIPVMLEEVLNFLAPKNGQVFIDMTFGAGGHSKAILNSAENITLYGLDRDPIAISVAKQLAARHYGDRLVAMEGKFSELGNLLNFHGVDENSVDGILIDAGCSSMQMDQAGRGFSLSKDGPLDMRMDGNRNPNQPTAADVVNALSEADLAKIFKTYGEEKQSRKIARAIVEYRRSWQPISTTKELAHIVSCAFTHREAQKRKDKLSRPTHTATKTFQALRIFVNNELNELAFGLEEAQKFLKPGGKLAVLTFHSLEDRIVKRFLRGIDYSEKPSMSIGEKMRSGMDRNVKRKEWREINKKVIESCDDDVASNPRARSAKLRTAIKIDDSEN
ncbi:12S rRNA N(4)-cytidine methyltransferase METTL15-like [Ptychodera flava]|uniref:12S rRNA N(4)-cytidine methyltransferase METTL15-like n=1 Tax=Ptychodera flava TaxID=63121 RepID=UPI00396AA4D1